MIDGVDGIGEENGVAFQAGGVAQSGREVRFSDPNSS